MEGTARLISMTQLFENSWSLLAAFSALAGIVAVVLAILAVGTMRRWLHALGSQLRELRRHPLVGDLPAGSDPSLKTLTLEFNLLLGDLRSRVQEARARPADLAALAGGPPDIALVGTDAEWRILSFSRGAVILTGWEPEEILERHVELLFAAGDWERVLPKLSRRSFREAGITESVRWQRRDGSTVAVQVSIAGSAGEEGGSSVMLLAARDLTEQKTLESRLRESEERYRRLVEGLSDGAFIVQEDSVAYANPSLARLLGLETEALRGVPFKDLVHSRDLLRILEIVRRAESGEQPAGETTCRLLSRDRRHVEARIAWCAIEYRGRRAVIGTVTDITERARFERILAESEARLQATLDSTGDGILVLEETPHGRSVTLANRAFCDRFGVGAETLVGLSEPGLVRLLKARCAEPDKLEAFLASARSGAEVKAEALEVTTPRRAIVDLLSGPVRSAAGEAHGTMINVRDVTERVDGERSLRQSLDDLAKAKSDLEIAYRELAEAQKALAQRNDQLEVLNTELKSLDDMKSSLLANVSHELHTPLVSIKGYTEMILKRKLGPLTPEQERGLGVALKNIDRLIEMIDNLLSFSKMERGETQLTLEDSPLWQLLDEAIEMVGERIRKKNISVTTQYETDDLVVRGDRVKLGQVLTNLLTNAVKFNREGGRITVTARHGPKGLVEVEVADTGVGIPADALDKIFERFYQVDASPSRRYEGTGIGLSIVRDILRLHGCSIRVASEPGRGSVFTFTLPLSRDQEASATRPPAGRGRALD
jgi:PAS domain S-box-containing protein